MKPRQNFLIGVMLIAIAGFFEALAIASEAPSTPPASLSALWPMVGLLLATVMGWAIPKLSAKYSFFHTALGAVVLGVIGAIIGSVIPIFQSGAVTWTALAWAAVSGATAFFARLNPGVPVGEYAPKDPRARE